MRACMHVGRAANYTNPSRFAASSSPFCESVEAIEWWVQSNPKLVHTRNSAFLP